MILPRLCLILIIITCAFYVYSGYKVYEEAIADMPIDEKIKEERSNKLIELSDENEKEYNQKYIGKEVEVLLEEREGEYLKGHTTNYMVVKMKTNENLENTIQKVTV